MSYAVATYILYLLISVSITVWVARILFGNGKMFLVAIFQGDEALAESTNRLLRVGFYLVNIGMVAIMLKAGIRPDDVAGAIEVLSGKVGYAMLYLGLQHLFNMFVFSCWRASNIKKA
jgi:hypothetical protein